GLDLGHGKPAALSLGDILRLDASGPDLQRGVAVLVLRALTHHLAVLQPEHGHGDVPAVLHEDAGHTQLLCDQTRTHRSLPFLLATGRVIASKRTLCMASAKHLSLRA